MSRAARVAIIIVAISFIADALIAYFVLEWEGIG